MREPADTTGRVARNALLKGAVQGTRVLSLLFVVLAARVLGPAQFGKFTFAYALATLLGASLDLGMHALLVREVARAPAEAGRQWATSAAFKLVLLLPAGLVFALIPLMTHRPADTTAAVWLLGAALVFQSFIELAVSVFTGFERLEFELGLRVTEKILLFATGVGGLVLGGGLIGVASAFALAGGAAMVLATVLVHRRFARLDWAWPGARVWALAGELRPVAGATVLALATSRLVPLLVALLAGDVAAGHFGAAARILDVAVVIPVAVGAAVYPVLSRTPAAASRFRSGVRQSAEVLLLLGAPVALVLAFGATWLTRLVYGAPYAPAAPLLALLGVVACLSFLNYLFGLVLLALDCPRRLLLVAATSFAASVFLTPPLVRAFGAMGGALALVLVEGVSLAGFIVALCPLAGVPFGAGAAKVVAAAGVAAGVAGLVPTHGPLPLGAALATYAGGILALRPVRVGSWSRLLRSVVARAHPPMGA